MKRTRKRQIAKAKHMMAWHDHTSYEWSQWWHRKSKKPKRWKRWLVMIGKLAECRCD